MARSTKKTMKRTARRQALPIEERLEVLHAVVLARPQDDGFDDILRELAETLGVPLRDARQRSAREGWELERNAAFSARWLARLGGGAMTEVEFIKFYSEDSYGHLVAKGPEGERLAKAIAHQGWVRFQADVMLWEAFAEERAAAKAFHEREERCEGRAA